MKPKDNMDIYALTWRLPVLVWQTLFFLAPLVFMVAMSFFLVKNYRMVEAFDLVNWMKMFSRDYFWDSYVLSLGLAALATACATVLAFPASYVLAFTVSDNTRRWAIFLLIIPYFTSYLVRIFSWYVLMAESGVANSILGHLGLGPFTMLNTAFATIVGYMALTLPLVIILQTLSMANIDRSLIEAAQNLGAGCLRTIVSVIVPAGKVGLIVGALFCFILSFGDFVSPYYLGGSKPPTLTILITDTTKSGQQWPRAAVIAVTMMGTLMVIAYSAVRYAYNKRTP